MAAPFAFLAHNSGQSVDSNVVTSGTLTSTGATVLFAVLIVVAASGAGVGVTDSKGNAGWTLDKTGTNGSNRTTLIFRCSNPASVGTLHTVSATGTTGLFPSISFLAFSGGIGSVPLDKTNSASGGGAGFLQTGSVTPDYSNELVLTGCCTEGAPTISGGYTLEASLASTGNAAGIGSAFQIQTAPTATNPTWTTVAAAVSAAIVTYRLASSGLFLVF